MLRHSRDPAIDPAHAAWHASIDAGAMLTFVARTCGRTFARGLAAKLARRGVEYVQLHTPQGPAFACHHPEAPDMVRELVPCPPTLQDAIHSWRIPDVI